MNSNEQIDKVAKFIKAYPPLIIAHNCGYDGYGVPPYSREATRETYKDCDYLEIDLILKNDNEKKNWWYFHQGLFGEDKGRNTVDVFVVNRFMNYYTQQHWNIPNGR